MVNYKKYLTIHGHFYQPPRENPWLEYVELQESAYPFHDWNERVCEECYSPNSVSKIVGDKSKVLDIVNNYAHMSFNMGATLLSWMEKFRPKTYQRVIDADIESVKEFGGHGNALAQVYNHIIMPLANEHDKYTQVIWGIEDFKRRFGRMPEGMWLAETACDDETLGVLADCGIKFTVLSPYQAEKVKAFNDADYTDVSHGEIDTTKPYRYYIKSRQGKSIDLFFYNAQVSQAVAFEELLKDGGRFTEKLKTAVKPDCDCLVNIATDGESYGHHTKFGDMALAYVLRIKSCDEGFTLTNYGQFLEKFPPKDEVVIKPVSSWSCCHGVGRWMEDCGCSTGGEAGWNQKWRKPLREALDFLRDKLAEVTELEGKNIFKDVWSARNDYISVILDRSFNSVNGFFKNNLLTDVNADGALKALRLMEIQRQCLLMYTSCGWFFNELSGLETVQIMKYAARAMQLAKMFTDENLETEFLDILENAKSNIPEQGTGKDIWQKYVKPSIVDEKNIATIWALKSLYFENIGAQTKIYCYDVYKHKQEKFEKGTTKLVVAHVTVTSEILRENTELVLALMQFADGDFHCGVKAFESEDDFENILEELGTTYENSPPTESFRLLDKFFGRDYLTFNDISYEEKKNVLNYVVKNRMKKVQSVYREVYRDTRSSMHRYRQLDLIVPHEFALAAKYTLSQDFNNAIDNCGSFTNNEFIQKAVHINDEAKLLNISLYKEPSQKLFSEELSSSVQKFVESYNHDKLTYVLNLFSIMEKLDISPDISEAQNTYFNKVYSKFSYLIAKSSSDSLIDTERFLFDVLKLGDKLNFNTDFYRNIVSKAAQKVAE